MKPCRKKNTKTRINGFFLPVGWLYTTYHPLPRTRIIHSKNWTFRNFWGTSDIAREIAKPRIITGKNIEPCSFLGKYEKRARFCSPRCQYHRGHLAQDRPRWVIANFSLRWPFWRIQVLHPYFWCFQKMGQGWPWIFPGSNLTRSDSHPASAGGTSINTAPAKDLLAVTLHLKGPKVSSQKKTENSGTQENAIYVCICIYIYVYIHTFMHICLFIIKLICIYFEKMIQTHRYTHL